jgi:hypothetical protein
MEYFVQQLINGITLGAIYGLIAIGYTMVYGIIGMINFAHGDIFMIGAFIALIAFRADGLARGHLGPLICSRAARRDGAHRALRLDHRAHRLPAAARLVPPGAADLRDRHVDRSAITCSSLRARASSRCRRWSRRLHAARPMAANFVSAQQHPDHHRRHHRSC